MTTILLKTYNKDCVNYKSGACALRLDGYSGCPGHCEFYDPDAVKVVKNRLFTWKYSVSWVTLSILSIFLVEVIK
jgi:hypothetical protein